MKPTPKNRQHIANCINAAKKRFEEFSEVKAQEVFCIVREAKQRGLLRGQPPDRCLNDYINAANSILLTAGTEDFNKSLFQDLNAIYAYIALVATNTIQTTA